MSKVMINFVKNSGTSQKCNNITTPYPIFVLLSVKYSLTGGKKRKKIKLSALKSVVVAEER